jgi:hypothetical protein
MSITTPVALFCFARPQTTAVVFEAIARAQPSRLLLVADGARESVAGEAELVARTRAIVEKVDWPCQVETNFSPVNLGCRKRLSSGLDWVFSRCEEAIILEDDCHPSADFFRFCEEMLDRYRRDHSVMLVSGANFIASQYSPSADYYFTRYTPIWGWASWAHRWKYYDVDMLSWPRDKAERMVENYLRDHLLSYVFNKIFDGLHTGYDTWDLQLTYAAFRHKMLSIVPARNLVLNIGFGEGAAHTSGGAPRYVREMLHQPMRWPLRHPASVERDARADRLLEGIVRLRPRLKRRGPYYAQRARQWLRSLNGNQRAR